MVGGLGEGVDSPVSALSVGSSEAGKAPGMTTGAGVGADSRSISSSGTSLLSGGSADAEVSRGSARDGQGG